MLDSDEDEVMVIKLFFAAYFINLCMICIIPSDLFFLEQIMDAKTGML